MIPIPVGEQPTAIQQRHVPRCVTCESCGQEYVYLLDDKAVEDLARFFPAVAAEEFMAERPTSLVAAAVTRAVAPCPRCGHIQRDMAGLTADTRRPYLFVAGIVVLFVAALFFFYLMSNLANAAARPAEDDTRTAWSWLIEGLLVASGVGLLLGDWIRRRRWDPNSQPVATRLKLAGTVSLTKEAYSALLAASDSITASETPQAAREGVAVPPAATGTENGRERGQVVLGNLRRSGGRSAGWRYVLFGGMATVVGFGSYFDTHYPTIYVGAMIIGPILLIRGIYLLVRKE
jgi:hypothetical protein